MRNEVTRRGRNVPNQPHTLSHRSEPRRPHDEAARLIIALHRSYGFRSAHPVYAVLLRSANDGVSVTSDP